MPTSSDPTRRMRLVLPLAGAIILSLFAALHPSDPSTARGALCGGGLVLVAFLVARHVRGGRDNAFVRGAKGQADERDALILARAGACVGLGIVSSDVRPCATDGVDEEDRSRDSRRARCTSKHHRAHREGVAPLGSDVHRRSGR